MDEHIAKNPPNDDGKDTSSIDTTHLTNDDSDITIMGAPLKVDMDDMG